MSAREIVNQVAADQHLDIDQRQHLLEATASWTTMTRDQIGAVCRRALDARHPLAPLLVAIAAGVREERLLAEGSSAERAAILAEDPRHSTTSLEPDEAPSPADFAALESMRAELARDTAEQMRARRVAGLKSELHRLRGRPDRTAQAAEISRLEGELASLVEKPRREMTNSEIAARAMARAHERMATEGE